MVVVEVSAVLLLSTVLAEGPNTQLGSSVICHGCCQPSSVPAPMNHYEMNVCCIATIPKEEEQN